MKILVVTTEYGKDSTGGVESVVSFLLKAIDELTDWDAQVASLRMSRRAKESRRLVSPRSWFVRPIAVTRTVRGVIVHDIGCALAELEPTRFWPRRSVDLLADASDVVVVVSGTPAVCHALSRTKTPVVLQVATLVARERRIANSRRRGLAGKYHSLMTWLTSRIDERGLSVPKAVLVENRLMLEECQARMVRWPELCPPGIDTQTFKPGPGGDRSPYILFVARLGDSRKNVSGLLRAFSRARHLGGVTQNLVLAGLSAPSADDLGLVDELGLSSAVEVLSPVTKVELVALYQGADLFASASFEEGLGLTYLEAMSCGLPVVTTNNAGAAFILDSSSAGSMVELGDDLVEALATELVRWCKDDTLRRTAGRAARELSVSRFSSEAAARAFINAIENAEGSGDGIAPVD